MTWEEMNMMNRFANEISKLAFVVSIGMVFLLLAFGAFWLLAPKLLLNILRYGIVAVSLIAALSLIISLAVILLRAGKNKA